VSDDQTTPEDSAPSKPDLNEVRLAIVFAAAYPSIDAENAPCFEPISGPSGGRVTRFPNLWFRVIPSDPDKVQNLAEAPSEEFCIVPQAMVGTLDELMVAMRTMFEAGAKQLLMTEPINNNDGELDHLVELQRHRWTAIDNLQKTYADITGGNKNAVLVPFVDPDSKVYKKYLAAIREARRQKQVVAANEFNQDILAMLKSDDGQASTDAVYKLIDCVLSTAEALGLNKQEIANMPTHFKVEPELEFMAGGIGLDEEDFMGDVSVTCLIAARLVETNNVTLSVLPQVAADTFVAEHTQDGEGRTDDGGCKDGT